MMMLGKSFPLSIVSCPSGRKCTVWLNADYKRYSPELAVSLRCIRTGEKRKAVISFRQPLVEFNELILGEAYSLVVSYKKMSRQLIYKSHREKITTGHSENNLRVIGVGSGRCGTTSLAAYLSGTVFNDGTQVDARHESAAFPILHCIINKQEGLITELLNSFSHNIEIAPYFWLVQETLKRAEKIVHIVRDGRQVVTSGMVRGWYTRDSLWDEIKPDFPGTPFEKCCHYWANCCEVLKPIPHITVRLQDMQESAETRQSLLRDLDIKMVDKPFPKKNPSLTNPTVFKWQKEHYEIFHRICGKFMDEYYPGWETDDMYLRCITGIEATRSNA